MKLKEIDDLRHYISESELRETVEEIGDKISFRWYSLDQLIALVAELLKIDLLSVEYATREEILNVLCDCAICRNIRNQVNWDGLRSIRGRVEDDLKEYIDEILGD